MTEPFRSFVDYAPSARQWVMFLNDGFYPESLHEATQLYGPVVLRFCQLIDSSESSQRLLLSIQDESPQWLRLQLLRVFRKTVAPTIPFELLRQRGAAWRLITEFGRNFRDIREVQSAFQHRPQPDITLCALLWENQERGKKALDLKARFFESFEQKFPELALVGPDVSGDGIRLRHVLPGIASPDSRVDFLVRQGPRLRVLGWSRYERDVAEPADEPATEEMVRGVDEMRQYCGERHEEDLRALVVVDGPGLLNGDAWSRYGELEKRWEGRLVVTTLRMFEERVQESWIADALPALAA